jgi:hypothetical protein
MTLEDLQYIFKDQIEEGTEKLYFMLVENNLQLINRHPADDLAGLLPMLDNFQYASTEGRCPRFYK